MTNLKKFFSLSIIPLAFALGGCGPNHDVAEQHRETHAESGVSYHTRHGLFIPPVTAEFIGLKFAEVAEQQIESGFEFTAQVYRAASEARFVSLQSDAPAALASGAINSSDAAKFSENQSVTVRHHGGKALSGRVVSLERHREESEAATEVLLAIADPQQSLANGSIVTVNASFESEVASATIPRTAVLRTTEGDFVYTASGEHLVRTRVVLGARNDKLVQVTDGLYAGDQVAVQPVMTLWMAELQFLRGGKPCADGH